MNVGLCKILFRTVNSEGKIHYKKYMRNRNACLMFLIIDCHVSNEYSMLGIRFLLYLT